MRLGNVQPVHWLLCTTDLICQGSGWSLPKALLTLCLGWVPYTEKISIAYFVAQTQVTGSQPTLGGCLEVYFKAPITVLEPDL